MAGNFVKAFLFTTVLLALIPGECLYSQGARLGVQGILRKSNGTVVDDGNYSLTFKIYNVAEGGSALWTETQSEVEVNSGVYSTLLGTVTELNLPFDTDYFLGVKVGSTPEISPRAQLTVAPYVLSLKGNSNLFPSTGTVGIGTASPDNIYQLDLHNTSGAAKVLAEGTTGAVVELKKGSITGQIGYGTTDNTFRINPGAYNTLFRNNSSNRLTITSSGISVTGTGTFSNGITIASGDTIGGNIILSGSNMNNTNNTNFKLSNNTKLSVTNEGLSVSGRIEVIGSKSYTGSYAYMAGPSSVNTGFASGQTNAYSISCNERILATEFNAFSDSRIKKDVAQSNGTADLEILSNLRVCDYRYIDVFGKGAGYKKGFIAQEVKAVFPEAVSGSTDFIPDIYSLSTDVRFRGTALQITIPAAHGLKTGDKVRLLLPAGQRDCTVTHTPDSCVFEIDNWADTVPAQVFVFGRQVDDFLQVDYDRIHTLNVSAVQELLRRKDMLESEKARLWKENAAIRASLDQLDVSIQKMEATLSH